MASHFKTSGTGNDQPGAADAREANQSEDALSADEPLLPVGRHARHSDSVAHGTSPAVTGAFQRLDPSVTGAFAAIAAADLQPIAVPVAVEEDAPRPVSDDPSITGSFARITSDQAIHAVTRDNATVATASVRSHADKMSLRNAHAAGQARPTAPSRRGIVAIVAVAIVVVVALGIVLYRAITSAAAGAAAAAATQAAPTESVEMAGTTYALSTQDDGARVLTAVSADGGEPIAVCVISGDPAQLIVYNGSIVMPESHTDATWDVVAYTPGGEAGAAQVVDGSGEPVNGVGAIVATELQGSDLVITDSTGVVTKVALS